MEKCQNWESSNSSFLAQEPGASYSVAAKTVVASFRSEPANGDQYNALDFLASSRPELVSVSGSWDGRNGNGSSSSSSSSSGGGALVDAIVTHASHPLRILLVAVATSGLQANSRLVHHVLDATYR